MVLHRTHHTTEFEDLEEGEWDEDEYWEDEEEEDEDASSTMTPGVRQIPQDQATVEFTQVRGSLLHTSKQPY